MKPSERPCLGGQGIPGEPDLILHEQSLHPHKAAPVPVVPYATLDGKKELGRTQILSRGRDRPHACGFSVHRANRLERSVEEMPAVGPTDQPGNGRLPNKLAALFSLIGWQWRGLGLSFLLNGVG